MTYVAIQISVLFFLFLIFYKIKNWLYSIPLVWLVCVPNYYLGCGIYASIVGLYEAQGTDNAALTTIALFLAPLHAVLASWLPFLIAIALRYYYQVHNKEVGKPEPAPPKNE